MFTDEQKAELKAVLDKAVIDKIEERMAKVVDRKFVPGEGDPAPSGDKSKELKEFLRLVKNDPQNARLKVLSEGTDSQGGFLVPEQTRIDLFMGNTETAKVRPFATKVAMASDTFNWPAVDETSHVSTLFGGVVCYWTEEAGAKTASYPTFRNIKLIAKKLIGFVPCPDELLQDSIIPIDTTLTAMFTKAIGFYEDTAFLNGTGVGQPLGIFKSGALVQPYRATLLKVALADLANIMARMLPESLYAPSTIWIASPAVLAELIPLVATVLTWLPSSGGIAGRIPASLLGMPLAFSEKVPTLGTTGDIGLYDLSYYLVGDRNDLRVDSSIHYKFNTDETTFRFVKRIDGQPMVNSPFTPANSGATLSPFVQLKSTTSA